MKQRNTLFVIAGLVLLLVYLSSSGIDVLVDLVWYGALGYEALLLKTLATKWILGGIGGLIMGLFLCLNLRIAVRGMREPSAYLPAELQGSPLAQWLRPQTLRRLIWVGSAVLGLLAGISTAELWQPVLLYLYSGPFGETEPIFGRDVSFYLFELPIYGHLQTFLWSVLLPSLLACVGIYMLQAQRFPSTPPRTEANGRETPRKMAANAGFQLALPQTRADRWHLGILVAVTLLIMAAGLYLRRFELMYERSGLFAGPGYADIHGTIPMLSLKWIVLVLLAIVGCYGIVQRNYRLLIGGVAVTVLVWVGSAIYTTALQRFVVTPNELEKERPFLSFHIKATNRAFALDQITERSLVPGEALTAADIEENAATINNIRLWDHEPLLDTFSQIQEIRTYYEFVSVDNDRYQIDGELRQMMLSPRELSTRSLPSRTWVNERLTFTHGYGLTLGPVNQVDAQGLPVLHVRDLPPQSDLSELDITRPEIYFGELDNGYIFVNTAQEEFNYPEGERNVFSLYKGDGGVAIGSLFRRLLFAIYFRDMKILLAEDLSPDSRVLIRRNILQRAARLTPFFQYDSDPYLVIDNGRLVWILDGYTTSKRYPYAEHMNRVGNYVRNPIKAVVDAYSGAITFYLADGTDPIAQAYATAFPGLIQPLSELPDSLKAHLRHPQDYFGIQAQLYATYHMREVNTFYNKEDQWEVPIIDQKQMEPYFTVMRLPEERDEEFILMLPFTPRLKDNLSAWMVARNDGDQYGKLVVYVFPKQELIFGPKQMVARINQDPVVSQQITLWDQSGSNVIRGTLLVIPIRDSLLYIQPIYLRAEDGRIPELKRVVVGYRNRIAMGIDLDDALVQIFDEGIPVGADFTDAQGLSLPTERAVPLPLSTGPGQGLELYKRLQRSAGQGNWSEFGQDLDALGEWLRGQGR